MKKTIIAGILAVAAFIPSAIRAEEPATDYNMVITLQNGTTITLGHNDIKNITFNGEDIVVDGNIATTIEELTTRSNGNLDRIHMLAAEITALEGMTYNQIADLEGALANSMVDISANRSMIGDLTDRLLYVEQNTVNSESRINELTAMINVLFTEIEVLKGELSNLASKVEN